MNHAAAGSSATLQFIKFGPRCNIFFILKENHPNCYKNGSSSEERKDEEGSNLTDESEKTKAEQGSNPMNESEKDDLDKVGNETETKQQIIIQR